MMADIKGDFNSYIIASYEISYYHPVAIHILITFPADADNISFSHALFQVDYEQALYRQRVAW